VTHRDAYEGLNPDFAFRPGAEAVTAAIPAGVREQPWVEALLRYLHDRDRDLERYLNRDVMRRAKTTRIVGNGTAHAGTAWQLVTPAVDVAFSKASPTSHLTVIVGVAGIYTDPGAPSWVEFGVLVNGVDYPVARRVCNTSGNHYQWAGSVDVSATTLVEGTYTCSLRVRGQNAGTAWTSFAQDSISVTITESA